MKNIAIFASGTGSNATKIVRRFAKHASIQVALVVSNKATAPVLQMAASNKIPTLVINRKEFYDTEKIITDLANYNIDLIALAGFMWLVPPYLVNAYPNQIVNIHPALLPKYGGKGMYGMNVHEAVWASREKESGITIHYVNEAYDEGSIIYQASCPIAPADTPAIIRKHVLKLEHFYFPRIIESLLVKDEE